MRKSKTCFSSPVKKIKLGVHLPVVECKLTDTISTSLNLSDPFQTVLNAVDPASKFFKSAFY